MEKEKTNTTTPASGTKVTFMLELSFDTYAKLLKHSKRNDQTVEQTVRNLIEEGCK